MKGGKVVAFRRMFRIFLFSFLILSAFVPLVGSSSNDVVYVVPIEDTVEKGLFAFLQRAVETAEEEQASAIIFELNTPGGVVDAAGDIGKLMTSTDLETVAFVNKDAISAGAFIALNMDKIYMVPGASMGSAAIIDQSGNTAGKKAESYWISKMSGAATQNGRDPLYAQAMVDEDVDLPQYGAGKGELLTLTAEQALEVGYSEGTVNNLDQLLDQIGYSDAEVRTIQESFAEKVARFITNPIVVSILLTIGSLGLVIELYSPGFGIPGFMGLSSLMLFFYGHLVAGLAGYETLLLFIVGIGLIILEFFLPGGIAGTIGFVSILASLFLATDNVVHMGISLLIAIGVSIIAMILMVKVFGKKMRLFKKIILTDSTSTESGYVSNKNRLELIGMEGITLTQLRPAGTAVFGDERLDVVSEGRFVGKDVKVKIVKVEGSRIVVREI